MNDDVVYECASNLLPQHKQKMRVILQYQIVTIVRMTMIHTPCCITLIQLASGILNCLELSIVLNPPLELGRYSRQFLGTRVLYIGPRFTQIIDHPSCEHQFPLMVFPIQVSLDKFH